MFVSKRLLAVVAAVALFVACSVDASAETIIDFDNLPGGGTISSGTVVDNQYSSVGVTFLALEEGSVVSGGPIATTAFAPVGQDGNRLGNFYGGSTSDRADILRITFAGPVSNVSFDFFPQGSLGDDTLVNAYDSGGGLISSNTTGISGFPVIANYSVVGSNIARIDILQPTDDWNWGMDDLRFTSSAVPEPGTLALLGLGLFGVAFTRRRRMVKAS